MKDIKITALHLGHGGVEKVICSLANLFVELGHNTEILCTYNLCEPVYILDERVKVSYLTSVEPNREELQEALSKKNPISIFKEIVKAIKVLHLKKKTMINAIKEIDNATVISTRNETSTLLSKYGKNSVYKIAQLHHDHKFDSKLIKDFRENYTNIDLMLLLTEELTEEVKNMMQGYNSRTECLTVPNFIDEVPAIKAPIKDMTLVTAGRLHSDKGYHRLLDIWKLVDRKTYPYQLIILGDGELRGSLEHQAAELGLGDSVIFKGMVNHDILLNHFSKAKMFLMTSITEALPMVLLEAMSQATIPVAFDVRVGPRSIITNDVNGFLIEDDNLQAYAHSIENYLEKYLPGNKYEVAALERAAVFTKDRVKDLWIKVLDRTNV